MNTCSNCGELVPAGATACQRCGLPISSMVGSAADYKRVAPQQPELPAWLESLRAGDHPVEGDNGQVNFSAADLMDEGNTPSWMRPEQRGDTAEHQFSGKQPAWPASDPGMGSPAFPAEGLTANSLIDEQSLPNWMRENQVSAGHQPGQANISAGSLVQPEALPNWMREMQPPAGSPPQASGPAARPAEAYLPPPEQAPASAGGFEQASSMPSWMRELEAPGQMSAASDQQPFAPLNNTSEMYQPGQASLSAGSLIQPEALPAWMREQEQATQSGNLRAGEMYQPGQANLSGGSLVQPEAMPPWMRDLQAQQQQIPAPTPPVQEHITQRPAAPIPGQPLSAHDLVDPQQLPAWMTSGSQPGMGTPNGLPPEKGFNAASLLDASALPSWMRESQQTPQSFPQPSGQGQSYQPQGLDQMPPSSGGSSLAGPSLIDMNALPAWLRSVEEPLSGGGQPPTYIAQNPLEPPRVENIHVPNRPRSEMQPQEQSEAAANVFASMLGVASTTPFVQQHQPGDPFGQMGGQAPQDPRFGQMGPPPQGMPMQGQVPMMSPTPNMAPPGFNPPSSPSGYPGNYGQMQGSQPGMMQGYQQGSQPGMMQGYQQGSQPGMMQGYQQGNGPQGPGGAGQDRQSPNKPAKRSFLDVIRGWFPRSN